MSANALEPLVSVVVPAYCHKTFVAEALQSVYDQTHTRIELIVIDDASSDGTLQEVAKWASEVDADGRFERFNLFVNTSNLGAHNTINRGCSMCRGEYIAILNSDDAFHPARIEKLVRAMAVRDAHMAFSRVAPVDDKGAFVSPAALPSSLCSAFESADRAVASLPALSLAFHDRNIAISTGNFLFTHELYQRIGPFADLKYVHDWDFALRSTLIAEPAYVPEDLYFYRLHGSNSFSQLSGVAEVETEIVRARYRQSRRSVAIGGVDAGWYGSTRVSQ